MREKREMFAYGLRNIIWRDIQGIQEFMTGEDRIKNINDPRLVNANNLNTVFPTLAFKLEAYGFLAIDAKITYMYLGDESLEIDILISFNMVCLLFSDHLMNLIHFE